MKTRVAYLPALLFLFVLGIGNLLADGPPAIPMPPENPEGNVGALRSQVVTGGSYDIHSGNASRIVNDLHVPGALGTYGLDFTRYWNSVHNEDTNSAADWPMDFGYSGWSHSWRWKAVFDWEVPDPENGGSAINYITSITVTFPDGHATKFKLCRWTQYPWGEGRVGPPYYESHHERNWPLAGEGVHDFLAEMAEDGSEFFIHRADGGSVRFTGYGAVGIGGVVHWQYRATEVYDPHGLRTTLSYDGELLIRVEDEGNRWLNIVWKTFPNFGAVIGRVETGGAAGSQYVDYRYSPAYDGYVLGKVLYPDTPAPGQTAAALYTYGYSYQGDQPGVGPQSELPILKRADDPHFAGAMTKIFYNYYGRQDCRPPNFVTTPPPVGYFDWFWFTADAITEERSDGAAGALVSQFAVLCEQGTRKEFNGLGGERIFYFGRSANDSEIHENMGYQLTKVTDFAFPNPYVAPFRKQNGPEPTKVWDGRGIKTTLDYYDTDQPSAIHYIDGSHCLYDRVDAGNASGSMAPDPNRMHYQQHHWLFKKTDENGNVTVYRRDERRRVTNISYYDAGNNLLATEGYTYNQWNQVTTHTLPSGAIQTYQYNALHQLVLEFNNANEERKEYTYDGLGRVETMRDTRAIAENAYYTEKMEYNGRHDIIKIHYRATGGSPDPTVTYEYDKYGNRTAVIDELGHRKDYTYDSYRRCTSMTEQVSSGANCPAVVPRRWDWLYNRMIDYGPNGQMDHVPSSHTSKEWSIQIEPAFNEAGHRRGTSRTFDVNNRMLSEQTGLIQLPGAPLGHFEPPGADAETHSVTYDANGQKQTSTDPLGRVTTYGYNQRNRLETTTEPKRENQPAYPVTRLDYDRAGNKTKITFPDMKTQEWLYFDPFGQPRQFKDERGQTTYLDYWQWGPMKKLQRVTTLRSMDNGSGTEHQKTEFYYDGMGRPQTTIFPDESREIGTYELGQLKTFQTRRGQKKIIDGYDARGRETHHYWLAVDGLVDPATPAISRLWDDANRMTRIWNNVSIIDYSYDEAGGVRTEGTTVTGSALREVRYCRYPSGDVAQITYPNGTVVNRFYTPRGQLQGVGWGVGSTSYAYLRDGRVDYQAWSNNLWTKYEYDGRGMIGSVLHKKTGTGGGDLARRDYWRDQRDRITAWKRGSGGGLNGMENGQGNRYGYDEEGQLTSASYRVPNPGPEGTPGPSLRTDIFSYDELGNRKGSNYLASVGWRDFTRKNNGLNQYSGWWPYCFIKYDDDLGWEGPGEANGVVMQDGWITAGFNALNQPVQMLSPQYSAGLWMWFGYDPLGRCVKRWVGPIGSPPNSMAMYFYYDGWNLIQEGASGPAPNRVYVHGGRVDEIVASWGSGLWSYHQYDAQGNCIMLTDENGLIREQYDYDAFGRPYVYSPGGSNMGSSSMYGNRFLFTGREWLKELKVYDYRNRLYNPELGRFLQPDPIQFKAGDYNLYRYCHNDPVNKSDPMGLEPTSDTWNEQMRFQSGTILSSREFNLLRRGQAYLAEPTGNYKDKKVGNHINKGEIPKHLPGGTIYNLNLDEAREVAGKLIIQPTLNWYVQKENLFKTDVVIRELEHVSRYLYWQGEGDLGVAVRSFNRNPTGFDALKATLRDEKIIEDIWHESDIHRGNRHILKVRPAKIMDAGVIEKAILSVAPKEAPHIGNPLLGY